MPSSHTILHIPHSSTVIPQSYLADYLIDEADLRQENLVMGDLYTDTLFPTQDYPSLIFPYSRLFVDVERFRDDTQESMAARGMGVLYERGHDLKRIRQANDLEIREEILRKYYDPHHAQLTDMVDQALVDHGEVLIIDCHSFPRERLPYNNPEDRPRPEICIGTDAFHTPGDLADRAVNAFQDRGYSVEIDFPFAGSLVPMKHYGKDARVRSIMIEVRRDLFTDVDTFQKSEGFNKVQGDIGKVIHALEHNDANPL